MGALPIFETKEYVYMRKKCRFIVCISAICLILSAFTYTHSSALEEQLFITVKINGQPIFVDTNPYIKQSRTYVPIRFVAEAFQMEVDWVQDEKKVVLSNDTAIIEMWIGSNKLLVNSSEIIMDTPVEGVDGRTMVPIRFFAEVLDFSVRWDDLTCSVELVKEKAEIPVSRFLNRSYTDDDLIWLARIVEVEANNLSMAGKVAVANVVLNRKKSSDFPGTIKEVIFDSRYTVQFPPAHKEGFAERIPGKSSVIAAKMALEGINNIADCLFFNNKPFKNKSSDLYKVIEGEYFYK